MSKGKVSTKATNTGNRNAKGNDTESISAGLSTIVEWLNKPVIQRVVFFLILAIGIFARVWQFGEVPGDINQDEAFGGYEAYSLLHYGKDSAGYAFPVYLTTWGSGMSVLNSLLMIPFIAVFGLKTWVIRMPQMIVAVLSIWVVYLIMKRIMKPSGALFCMFLVAIAPWHIFFSRWGMDCNLAPGFLLFGLYFFIRGVENAKYFLLSALMYGLSLYCYATIWPFVPMIILLQFLYCVAYKKISLSKEVILSCVILFVMAVPLLLFLLVNSGYMEEIRLPFLSIPKLVYMRSSEISFSNIPENFKNLWTIVTTQTDGLPWNATERFGLFYKITLPFFVLGLFYYIMQIVNNFRKKQFGLEIFIIIQLLAGIALGLLIHVNINRVNILFLPMILIAATGVCYLCQLINSKLLVIPVLIYCIMFVQFEQYYFTEYKQEISGYFCEGLEEAVEEAVKQDGIIYVSSSANYARVLFYSKENVNEYISTVQYTNYPSAFLDVSGFGRFSFTIDLNNIDVCGTYIVDGSVDSSIFTSMGFTTKQYGYYTLAYVE